MIDDKIQEMYRNLSRIESKLDDSANQFAAHLVDDALLTHEVRMLSKQRGYVLTTLAVVGTSIGAAITWAVHKTIGGGH
jgi:hypothetical protein